MEENIKIIIEDIIKKTIEELNLTNFYYEFTDINTVIIVFEYNNNKIFEEINFEKAEKYLKKEIINKYNILNFIKNNLNKEMIDIEFNSYFKNLPIYIKLKDKLYLVNEYILKNMIISGDIIIDYIEVQVDKKIVWAEENRLSFDKYLRHKILDNIYIFEDKINKFTNDFSKSILVNVDNKFIYLDDKKEKVDKIFKKIKE